VLSEQASVAIDLSAPPILVPDRSFARGHLAQHLANGRNSRPFGNSVSLNRLRQSQRNGIGWTRRRGSSCGVEAVCHPELDRIDLAVLLRGEQLIPADEEVATIGIGLASRPLIAQAVEIRHDQDRRQKPGDLPGQHMLAGAKSCTANASAP
jgi:hypothetical protein